MPDAPPNAPNLGDLGDIYDKRSDKIETYFDTTRFGLALPRRKWIVKPDFDGCRVKELDQSSPGLHNWFECHVIPRLWQLMMDGLVRAGCNTFFVKGPNWLEPPVTASPVDQVSETAVAVSGIIYRDVVTYTVPDRHVATILRFGHGLDDPTQWVNLQWAIRVSGKPIFNYFNFVQQRGTVVDPTPLASMIIVPGGKTIAVSARRAAAGAAINVYARLMGFSIPLHNVDQTGAFSQFHTM